MRRKISLYSTLLATLSMVSFIGCESANNTTSDNHPAVTVENFTTQGKPTKTVQTPWGDKQVYDPTQDPEIIEAFEYVSKQNKENGFRGREGLSSYRTLFKDVKQIQFNDMLRTKCVSPNFLGHLCNERTHYSANAIAENCSPPNFGQASLNLCESKSLTIHPDNEEQNLSIRSYLACEKNNYDYFDEIGSEALKGVSGEEDIDTFFRSGCLTYEIEK